MATNNEPTLQSLAAGQEWLASLLTDFIEEQRRVNEEQRQFNEEQRQFNEEQRQFNEHTDVRLLAIQNDIEAQRRFNEAQRQFNDRIERRLNTMHNDIAEIKGGHARTETLRRGDLVAAGLDFTFERALSAGELGDMVRENPDISSSIRANELESFTKADLVIKVKDREWLTNYLAVEISYTADQRDIERSRRNADLLTRFTGRPSHAVVASVRNDSVVRNLVSIGYVNWYQIPLRDLQAV